MLIPRDEWGATPQIPDHAEAPGHGGTSISEPLLANLQVGVAAVAEAHAKGKVEIGDDGMLHLPQLTARPDDGEPRRTREAILQSDRRRSVPDLLLDIDALCNFSEVLLGHRAETVAGVAGPVRRLARPRHRHDAKGGRDDPGASMWRVLRVPCARWNAGTACARQRTRGRVPGRIPIAAHWGTGEKASADMMSVDASAPPWNARVIRAGAPSAAGLYTTGWTVLRHHLRPAHRAQRALACRRRGRRAAQPSRRRPACGRPGSPSTPTATPTRHGGGQVDSGFDLCPRLRDRPSASHLPPSSRAGRPGAHHHQSASAAPSAGMGRVPATAGLDPPGAHQRGAGAAALARQRRIARTRTQGRRAPGAAQHLPVRLRHHRGLPARDPHAAQPW